MALPVEYSREPPIDAVPLRLRGRRRFANQAPTPNAVTVDVPHDGQVSFYNEAGLVNIVADIVGYYVDHSHDDRYYTKEQVDAALIGAATLYETTTRPNPPSARRRLCPSAPCREGHTSRPIR